MIEVTYRFMSTEEDGKIVGSKTKDQKAFLPKSKQINILNCVQATLFDFLKEELNSPLAVRDTMTYTEELVLRASYFEIMYIKDAEDQQD